jgi:hypothetical protein
VGRLRVTNKNGWHFLERIAGLHVSPYQWETHQVLSAEGNRPQHRKLLVEMKMEGKVGSPKTRIAITHLIVNYTSLTKSCSWKENRSLH